MPSPASICSSPSTRAECAEAVLEADGRQAERARLAEAGRARMLSNHAWPKSMQRLDGIIERCRSAISAARPRRRPCAAAELIAAR